MECKCLKNVFRTVLRCGQESPEVRYGPPSMVYKCVTSVLNHISSIGCCNPLCQTNRLDNNVREREFWLSILVSYAFSSPAFLTLPRIRLLHFQSNLVYMYIRLLAM